MNRKFIITLLLIIFILGAVKIIFVSLFSTKGLNLSQLNQTIILLEEKNQRLEEEISVKSALTNLYPKAQELGFMPNGKVVYLSTQTPVALR